MEDMKASKSKVNHEFTFETSLPSNITDVKQIVGSNYV